MKSYLWRINREKLNKTNLAKYSKFINQKYKIDFANNFSKIWKWSVDNPNLFWKSIWDFTKVKGDLGKTLLGEAFKKFQLYLKLLSNDGVILAISSKNNFEDVKECFNKNNEMVLSLKDFSSIQINWDEKYLNINKIANELNISKDSIVFFDDSKIEQDKMKKFNPDVNTICISKHPKDFINDINN